MNCTECSSFLVCRSLGECGAYDFDKPSVTAEDREKDIQSVIQAASRLVDSGRGGTLNRLQEIIEYSLDRKFRRIGLAYCWSMDEEAAVIAGLIRDAGLQVSAVSCTVGGVAQDETNSESRIHKVACNPLGQAAQLNAEGVDLVVAVGLCLGHDMLLAGRADAPTTTLVVKDRTSGHAPLVAIREMAKEKVLV